MKNFIPQNTLLDACVLYPMPVRDLLMNLAVQELFFPLWSDRIHEEWTRNLFLKRPDLNKRRILKSIDAMQELFEEANITDFEHLISDLSLPDPDDCHVLAAAIHAKADSIITFNLKDFPSGYVEEFGVKVIHPDDFIVDCINNQTEKCLNALQNQVNRLKNPPMTVLEVLQSLEKCNLPKSAKLFRGLI